MDNAKMLPIEQLRGGILRRKVSDVIVCRKYAAGLSLRKIARQLGVAQNTVRNALQRAGVPLRPRGGRWATCCRVCGKTPRKGRAVCEWHFRLEHAAQARRAYHFSVDKKAKV